MHNSTLIVLVILTIGQMLMMAFGAFILWMMGDLGGDAPQQMRREDSSRQSGKNLVHVPQEVVKLVEESPDELISIRGALPEKHHDWSRSRGGF